MPFSRPSMPPHSPGTAPGMIGEYPDKASPKDGAQSHAEGFLLIGNIDSRPQVKTAYRATEPTQSGYNGRKFWGISVYT